MLLFFCLAAWPSDSVLAGAVVAEVPRFGPWFKLGSVGTPVVAPDSVGVLCRSAERLRMWVSSGLCCFGLRLRICLLQVSRAAGAKKLVVGSPVAPANVLDAGHHSSVTVSDVLRSATFSSEGGRGNRWMSVLSSGTGSAQRAWRLVAWKRRLLALGALLHNCGPAGSASWRSHAEQL